MTPESLDRIKLFVGGVRHEDVIAAANSRLNGYRNTALEHQNRVALADLILADLAAIGVQDAG